jgi:hemolysin activation/secretion protein
MAGLNRLLESVSALYRSHGYPFVQVYMPPQTTVDGTLQIAILEGHYGKIQARGDEGSPARRRSS